MGSIAMSGIAARGTGGIDQPENWQVNKQEWSATDYEVVIDLTDERLHREIEIWPRQRSMRIDRITVVFSTYYESLREVIIEGPAFTAKGRKHRGTASHSYHAYEWDESEDGAGNPAPLWLILLACSVEQEMREQEAAEAA